LLATRTLILQYVTVGVRIAYRTEKIKG